MTLNEEKTPFPVSLSIKSWNTMCTWNWDTVLDSCGICKNQLVNHCVECSAKGGAVKLEDYNSKKTEQVMSSIVLNPEEGLQGSCSIAWGTCGHVFHAHCMSRWLVLRDSCPLCGKKWVLFKLTRIM